MKKLLFLIPLVTLVGCNSQEPLVVSTQQVVVMPDSKLFECPTVDRLPNPDTLTDIEVAKLLVQLQNYNVRCKSNIDAIKAFLVRSKKIVESN